MTQLHHMDHPSGGTGLPLLLLHGFTGAGDDFRHLFDLAALRSDRRVVVPDLLGHGQTGGPMPPLIHRESARAVIALLDDLGVDRCLAIGCSLGGNTLLHVATMAPTRIAAMVVVAATPYFPEQARAVMREQPVSRFMAEHHDDMNFTPPLLATIQAPTLIVNGDRDRSIRSSSRSSSTARSRAPRSGSSRRQATGRSGGSTGPHSATARCRSSTPPGARSRTFEDDLGRARGVVSSV